MGAHNADYVPPVEAVEWVRRILLAEVDRHEKFIMEALGRGDVERAERWRRIVVFLERQLLGDGKGCVIRPFDPRKTDPEWRSWYYEAAQRAIDEDYRTGASWDAHVAEMEDGQKSVIVRPATGRDDAS